MIKSVLKLIRFPNLLMVFLTMYLMRWSLIRPILNMIGFEPETPEFSFVLLVLSTLLITAGGNIINDYHDVSRDRLNKPSRVVIDKVISRRQAITLHFILTITGVLLGLFVSLYHHLYWLLPVFPAIPVLLWFYSTSYQHKLFLGNLVISLVIASVPLMVLLFEYPMLVRANREVVSQFPDMFYPIIYWIGFYSIFAFLSNLTREIIKDAAEVKGDKEIGSKTIAVVLGQRFSKMAAFFLALVTLIGLSIIFFTFQKDWISQVYFGVFLAVPLIILLIKLILVKQAKGFENMALLSKIIMLNGLIYAPVAYLVIKYVLA